MDVEDESLTSSPLLDPQGPWYSQSFVNQIATGQQLQQQQQQQQQEKPKKKSRGNRADQHFRRRLRKRNLDEATKTMLMNERMHRKIDEMDVDKDVLFNNNNITSTNVNKRKRYASVEINAVMEKSLSQLSISQPASKRKCHRKKEPQQQQQQNGTSTKDKMMLPDYLNVPDRAIKQMISRAVKDGDKIVQWLDTPEKLQAVRQLAYVVNTNCYLQLQQQLWEDYYNIGTKDGVWTSRMSKTIAKEHNTCPNYGRSQNLIEQRRQTIQHQFKRTATELDQLFSQLPEWTDKAQPPMDSNLLSTAIQAYAHKGQHRLRTEFQHKRTMLQLDVDDHRLINAFYARQPNDEQIRLTKLIWQGTADECKAKEELAICRKRVSLKRLPQSLDTLIDHTIDPLRTMLSRPDLDKDRRATLASHCSKTITQYKFDLMALTIATAEDTARAHAQLTVDAMKDLRLLDNDKLHSSTEELIKVVEARQENMKKRAQQLLDHQLQSFFEQAPMEINDDGSVPVGAM